MKRFFPSVNSQHQAIDTGKTSPNKGIAEKTSIFFNRKEGQSLIGTTSGNSYGTTASVLVNKPK